MSKLPARPKPWERQEYDTDKSFHAFVCYRDLGASRSLGAAAQELGYGSRAALYRWSTNHNWIERAKAWDIEQDRVRREAQLEEVEKMSRRHARHSQAIGFALVQPVLAVIKRVEELRGRLEESDIVELFEQVPGIAYAYPQIARLERLARGEPTSIASGGFTHLVEEDDTEAHDLAEAIRDNPEARDAFYNLIEALQRGDSEGEPGGPDAPRDGRDVQALPAHPGVGRDGDAGGGETGRQADSDSAGQTQ